MPCMATFLLLCLLLSSERMRMRSESERGESDPPGGQAMEITPSRPLSSSSASLVLRLHCANNTKWGPKAKAFWSDDVQEYDLALMVEHHISDDR